MHRILMADVDECLHRLDHQRKTKCAQKNASNQHGENFNAHPTECVAQRTGTASMPLRFVAGDGGIFTIIFCCDRHYRCRCRRRRHFGTIGIVAETIATVSATATVATAIFMATIKAVVIFAMLHIPIGEGKKEKTKKKFICGAFRADYVSVCFVLLMT